MRIADIKPFVSTDRKCHVALKGGGSKDGYVGIRLVAVPEGVSRNMVTVKGDRGRPSIVHPANIESIMWHPTTTATDIVEAAGKGPDKPAAPRSTKPKGERPATGSEATSGSTAPNRNLWCSSCHAKGVTLTVVRDGVKSLLLCRDCKRSNDAGAPATRPSDVQQVYVDIQKEVARLGKSAKVDADLLDIALRLLRKA